MDVEIQNAIQIAWNPGSNPNLTAQAYEYLQQLRSNPSAWQACLSLFTRSPRVLDVTRVFSLDLINNTIQSRQLDGQSLQFLKTSLFEYVQNTYGGAARASAEDPEPAGTQNKLAQTLTLLFTVMYTSGWQSFFDDFWQLAELDLQNNEPPFNRLSFYLKILASVHDEIADVLVVSSQEKQKLHTALKDEIRDRDAVKIAASWQTILSKWPTLDPAVLQLCLKTIARWVSWTDISLVANEKMLVPYLDIATQDHLEADEIQETGPAYAAIDVFSEIIAKKMAASAKLDLIQALSVETVLARLVSSPSLGAARGTSVYDTDLAETVAKLVNNVVDDIVRILESGQADQAVREKAAQLLPAFIPHMLRFFSDEYDEVCSTVIPCLTELLGMFRKFAKQFNGLPSPYDQMLAPILSAIITKMRYDDTLEWGDEDGETDEAEFQELRKRLKILQQIVATIDENLFLTVAGDVVATSLAELQRSGSQFHWRDLEVGLSEMYLLGETALKNSGLYQKRAPTSAASEKLIFLMTSLIDSDVASYPHPAVHLCYMDICVRFNTFFDQHPQYIPRVLENFVTLMHSDHLKVRSRSWHFFLRFVRYLRMRLGNFSESVVRATADLLVIKAEVPNDNGADEMSSNLDSQSEDAIFQSQLYLFEAVGCIASAPAVSSDTQIGITKFVLGPLMQGLQDSSGPAVHGDERSIYQVHHLMQAIGTLARGISDWTPDKAQSHIPAEVTTEFSTASDSILATLGALKASIVIRTAARFAFSRLVGVLGFRVLEQLPQWIDGLLAQSSTKDELATFLRLLGQVIYGFKTQIRDILDTLLSPLLQRIFQGFSEPTNGTDEELNLGELRREFLSFIGILLNHDLDSVLVSPKNQAIFDTLVSAIEHFAKDASDHSDAKVACGVLVRMCEVWGGPSIDKPAENNAAPSPVLPGFDDFMLTRISALTWAIMTNPAFDAKDTSANRVVGEIATLQQTILQKTGQAYIAWLRDTELRNLGAQDAAIAEYIRALVTTDAKGFKQYLLRFLQQSRGQ